MDPRDPLLVRWLAAARRAHALTWGVATLGITLSVAFMFLLVGYGRSHSKGTRTVALDWPVTTTAEEAAGILASKGLVESQETMAIFLRATGGTDDFAPGPHLLSEGASPWELRRLLSRSMLQVGRS